MSIVGSTITMNPLSAQIGTNPVTIEANGINGANRVTVMRSLSASVIVGNG